MATGSPLGYFITILVLGIIFLLYYKWSLLNIKWNQKMAQTKTGNYKKHRCPNCGAWWSEGEQ